MLFNPVIKIGYVKHCLEDIITLNVTLCKCSHQGHPRLKVSIPNERAYTGSYLWIIVFISTGT